MLHSNIFGSIAKAPLQEKFLSLNIYFLGGEVTSISSLLLMLLWTVWEAQTLSFGKCHPEVLKSHCHQDSHLVVCLARKKGRFLFGIPQQNPKNRPSKVWVWTSVAPIHWQSVLRLQPATLPLLAMASGDIIMATSKIKMCNSSHRHLAIKL